MENSAIEIQVAADLAGITIWVWMTIATVRPSGFLIVVCYIIVVRPM